MNTEPEAYLRRVVTEIKAARAADAGDAAAIAEALNAKGVTSRKGRPWTAATVKKFLASPGARRHGLEP